MKLVGVRELEGLIRELECVQGSHSRDEFPLSAQISPNLETFLIRKVIMASLCIAIIKSLGLEKHWFFPL